MTTPGHLVVATLEAAIQHNVINIATQILNGQDLPAILLVGVVTALLDHGIVLRLHPDYRAEGNELMTREEARALHEGRVEEPDEPVVGAGACVQTLLARLTGGGDGIVAHYSTTPSPGNHSQAGQAGLRWIHGSATVKATLRVTSGPRGAAAAEHDRQGECAGEAAGGT